MKRSAPAAAGAPAKSNLRLLLILLAGAAGIAALSLWPSNAPETISPLKGGAGRRRCAAAPSTPNRCRSFVSRRGGAP